MINCNNHDIKGVHFNGHVIKKVYSCGGNLVYENETPPVPPTPSYSGNYFTVEPITLGSNAKIKFRAIDYSPYRTKVYYRFAGLEQWNLINNYEQDDVIYAVYNVSSKNPIEFKCVPEQSSVECSYISLTNGTYKIYGNPMSLFEGDSFTSDTVSALVYNGMSEMFANEPVVDASGLYLPLKSMKDSCYARMFRGCTLLEKSPTLPAETLDVACYSGMFSGCTSLNEITCLATNISAASCTSNWVYNVAANGTFKCKSTTNWTEGDSGIPSGWTRVNI